MSNASGWKETTLGAEADLLTGFPFKSERYSDSPDTIPLVRGDNIVQGAMRWDGVKRWPLAERGDYALYELREGDVVLAMDRPWIEAGLKYAAISKHDLPCLLVQRTARLRGGPKLDTRFLRYLIGSREFTQHIHAITTGTAVPHISGKQIKDFTFMLPPLAEQKAIAAVLGALDDKIELNRRMNATLEAMARALFQSWFVDFDPVRAKLDGRPPPAPDPPPPALFPEHLEDSPLGHIPKGWEVKTIESLCDVITSGGTPARMNKAYWEPATVPWFKTGELLDGPLIDAEESISEEGLANSSCKLWPAGTILFALYASPTVGRFGVLTKPGTANQAAAALIAKPAYGVPFLMGLLYEARAELQRVAVGAAQQNINQGVLKNHVVVAPPPALAKAYSDKVAPWFEQRIKLAEQSRTLATLRDTLLPKLLSGELPIREESLYAENHRTRI
jgi:type I restriction enzyme S subunit